jgi:hypothetical protein
MALNVQSINLGSIGKSGNPCERLRASCLLAIADIFVKMVVPTFGSLENIGLL